MMAHNNIYIPEEIRELLRKLLSGTPLQEQELAQLNQWYDDVYDEGWESVDKDLGQRMYLQIHESIAKVNSEQTRKDSPGLRLRSLRSASSGWKTQTWLRAAMVTFLLVATALVVYVSQHDTHTSPNQAEEWITYQNPAGQKSKVQLPDGSIIYINAATAVKYQKGFGQSHRDLFLEGESYFEVAKDSIPFRVYSGGLVTEAVGTSFNISTYDATSIRVQLTSGIVKVYDAFEGNAQVKLMPGEEVRLKDGQLSSVFIFDINQAIAWKEGTIWLQKTPLSEVISILERWYDVDITVTNPPKEKVLLTGEFKNAMLTHLLESLSYSYRFDYKIDKKNITITFNY
ncbi:FecR family protein [Echinicola rosea]|uniref:FecR family protein n=1 Tax=Echinicola rosea TaxID=1807691 RepID=A0ABQ1VBZ8_9BACT|nr:FecR family protein [Echinicola rosea]GGF47069.1 hypothetical protein GCM10011339_39490 [Echinicola rosea]